MAGQRGPSGWLAEAGRSSGEPEARSGAERGLRRASWPRSEPSRARLTLTLTLGSSRSFHLNLTLTLTKSSCKMLLALTLTLGAKGGARNAQVAMCADTCLGVSAVLVLPQRTTLAAWGGLFRLLAAQCTRDVPWPCGRLTLTLTEPYPYP